MHQGITPVLGSGLHKLVSNSYRNIKVLQAFFINLGSYELEDIGMVRPEDSHVGSPPPASLLDMFRSGVKNLHKGNRT